MSTKRKPVTTVVVSLLLTAGAVAGVSVGASSAQAGGSTGCCRLIR